MKLSPEMQRRLMLWSLPLHCVYTFLAFFCLVGAWEHQWWWMLGILPLIGGFIVLEHFGFGALIHAEHPHFPASVFQYTAAQKAWRKQYRKSGRDSFGCAGNLMNSIVIMLVTFSSNLWEHGSMVDHAQLLTNGVVLSLIYGVCLSYASNAQLLRYVEAFLNEAPQGGFSVPDDYPPKPVSPEN